MHSQDSFPRRAFLKTMTVAGTGAALGHLDLAFGAEPYSSPPAWVERAMRWAQLTLVEDDPGKFDPQFWLDYFQRTHSNAVCLSAGGCVAYYPTQVPFHHRSACLKDSDPFGTLVAGCPKLDMVILPPSDPLHTYHHE